MITDYNTHFYSKRELPNFGSLPGVRFLRPTICPICKHHIVPEHISTVLIDKDKEDSTNFSNVFATATFVCTACRDVFISVFKVKVDDITSIGYEETYYPTTFLSSFPQKYSRKIFSDNIESLSPSFVEIFNQAAAAELIELNEISGIGYRKSVEFLMKDYSIYFNPEESERISNPSCTLKQCIDRYVYDERVKQLAVATVFLGNDQSHYTKRHTKRDITDLKTFINALLHYIDMELILKDSKTITDN